MNVIPLIAPFYALIFIHSKRHYQKLQSQKIKAIRDDDEEKNGCALPT